jgi:hypothetical protein
MLGWTVKLIPPKRKNPCLRNWSLTFPDTMGIHD